MKSYPGLPASCCFIQAYYHVMYIPIHDMGHVLVENNRITLSKASAIKMLSYLEDAYLFYL